jgi:hypothetical protein
MCASVFLDVRHAFDKVWDEGLLYKLKSKYSDQPCPVLKSYLEERYFQVNIDDTMSEYNLIKAGVPQESVVGPLLYLFYAADAPTKDDTLIPTFADDTAILSSDADPARSSERLHHYLSLSVNWLKDGKSRYIRSSLLK